MEGDAVYRKGKGKGMKRGRGGNGDKRVEGIRSRERKKDEGRKIRMNDKGGEKLDLRRLPPQIEDQHVS